MNFDELLEIKKEIDELSLYYRALKERLEEIDEKFYSNNLLDLDSNDDDVELITEDSIDEKIRKGRSNYTVGKLLGYSLRYSAIITAHTAFDMPDWAYMSLIFANVAYYAFVVFGYEKITRKRLESQMEEQSIDIESLAQEKKQVERRLEYVRDRFTKLSDQYEKLVSKLGVNEYSEYLDYISEYLQFMLEHSKEMLKEASEACMHPDDDMEIDTFIGTEDIEENIDEVHKYEVKLK